MQKLSAAFERRVEELARRHGFSRDAVLRLHQSIVRGYGSMAQFDHPEFGGSGQWMSGGMTMVSASSDATLKRRVTALAADLAALAVSDESPDDASAHGAAHDPRSQDAEREADVPDHRHARAAHNASQPAPRVSLFVPPAHETSRDWWPAALGTPSSTGSQNAVRYAYFAQTRRLAIELHGRLTVYDTLDHQLGSFSQAQSDAGSLSFHSQHGLIELDQLPVVPADNERTG